jgi:hypothetical protein
VPTLTFQVLYCFFVVEHGRRKILHFNVTRHPTAEWVVQQRRETFPQVAPIVTSSPKSHRSETEADEHPITLAKWNRGALDRKLSQRVAGSLDRSERGSSTSSDPGLHLLLSRGPNPRLSWERQPGDTTCFFQADRICVLGFTQAPGWPASPIRLAADCLKRSPRKCLTFRARTAQCLSCDRHSNFLQKVVLELEFSAPQLPGDCSNPGHQSGSIDF